jgi:signal transduction histidine kinase
MQRTGIEVDCQTSFLGRLADETETHLFRIAQEALTNIARHSHATRVLIRLTVRDGHASLKLEDNGRGIEDIAAIGPGHSGLIGMRARARSAGGEMVFRTGKDQGLAIEVKVPARAVTHEQTEDPHFVG